jgi:hypothetical protein
MKCLTHSVLLLLLIIGISLCAHHPPAKLVVVASILNDQNSDQNASQIMAVLDKAGIHDYVFAGSVRLSVFVRSDEQAEAACLLKEDAQVHKYEIKFY